MKVRITFKDPDAVYDALLYANKKHGDGKFDDSVLEPWIRWGEYCTVEIDTELNTAVVIADAD